MGCQSLGDLYELYLLDALASAERDELEAHLERSCPYCLSQLREAAQTIYWLTQSAPAVRPSSAVKTRLLRRLPAPRAR